jgi:TonB family protein
MVYCNVLSDWIAKRAHADAVVEIQIDRVDHGHAVVTAQLFDERAKKTFDKKAHAFIPFTKLQGQIALTETQAGDATRDYNAPLTTPAVTFQEKAFTMPTCVRCPIPDYPRDSRQSGFQGTIYLLVTVLPDATATDIVVLRPVGYGLDASAIDTILTWKFKPGTDGQKRPVAIQVPVEIEFHLY